SQSPGPGGTGGARREARPATAILHFIFPAQRGTQAAPARSHAGSRRSGANALAASPLANPPRQVRGSALPAALAPAGGEIACTEQDCHHLDGQRSPKNAARNGMGRGWDYFG